MYCSHRFTIHSSTKPVYSSHNRPNRLFIIISCLSILKRLSLQRYTNDTMSSLTIEHNSLYVITTILGGLVPVTKTTCRVRQSDPWYDNDCRSAKRAAMQEVRTAIQARSAHGARNIIDAFTQKGVAIKLTHYIYLYFTINMVAQIINNTLLNELILHTHTHKKKLMSADD